MNLITRRTAMVILVSMWLPAAFAQQSSSQTEAQQQVTPGVSVNAAQKSPNMTVVPTIEENPGVESGGYEVKQSFEFGGRIANQHGNAGVWSTYVNLGSGPRLLEYSLDIHKGNHTGVLFDDLNFSNFGYGGDPNNVSRLLMQKGKVYTFNANFRRDRNVFDYDLLANPLNPPGNVQILQSPHQFFMTRRMEDVNLRLFPTSNVQFRAGWSRVTNEGTTFSTVHQGTEALLFQPTSYISDNYSGGISVRVIPRTSINYDQFYTFFKGDTTAQLAPGSIAAGFGVPSFILPNGNPVSLGIVFNSAAGQPCAAPVLPVASAVPVANPVCNGYSSYTRFGRVRNTYPTEQFSLQSSYWPRIDLSARAIYSSAESLMPDYASMFAGLESRTAAAIQNIVAPPGGGAKSRRLSLTSDFAATIRVTDRFHIVDQFRYTNFRIPGNWLYTTTTSFAPNLTTVPNSYSPAACPTATSPGCPQHTTSSGADVITDSLSDFLRQAYTVNTFELEYQFSRRVTGYLGYRFERRNITDRNSDNQVLVFYPTLPNRGACANVTLVNGVCTVAAVTGDSDFVQINGHSALGGFSARPTDKWRLNGDIELMSADNAFTRISPRHLQLYRIKTNYRPKDWMNLGAAVYIRENRNTALDIGNLQHNRSYSFTGTFMPVSNKWGFDLSYDYNDIFSQTNICFVSTPTPPGALSCGSPFLSGISVYNELSHFATGTLYLKPVPRVTADLGYTVTSSNGSTLILNPNAPTGPLNFNYHLPLASLAVQLQKHWVFKSAWNYYNYMEHSDPGPTLPRDFRGNVYTLSMRYIM
jgi:hypothetical protein